MHVYIAPEPGNPVLRRCTIIIIPDSDLFQSNTHISSPGSIQHMLPIWRIALILHMTIASCQVLVFYGLVNRSPHDSVAAGESRTRDLSVTGPTL